MRASSKPTPTGQYYGKMQYTPIIKETYYTIHVRGITINNKALDLPYPTFEAPVVQPFLPPVHY